MEQFVIARFYARENQGGAVAKAMGEIAKSLRAEPGCLSYTAYRSIRDPQLFFMQSRWDSEAAFERHAEVPHMLRFLGHIETLVDRPLDLYRMTQIA